MTRIIIIAKVVDFAPCSAPRKNDLKTIKAFSRESLSRGEGERMKYTERKLYVKAEFELFLLGAKDVILTSDAPYSFFDDMSDGDSAYGFKN